MIALITSQLWTILIGATLAFILGMFWYNEKVFGDLWAGEQPHRKMPEDFDKDMVKILTISAADALLFTTIALLLHSAYGIEGVLLLAVAVTTGMYANTVARGGTNKLFFIDAGFLLGQLVIITVTILIISG